MEELLAVGGQKKKEEGKVKRKEHGSRRGLAKRELDYEYGIRINV